MREHHYQIALLASVYQAIMEHYVMLTLMNALQILVRMVELVWMESILTIVHVLMVLLAQTVKQTLMNAFLILVKMEERVLI